MLPDLNKVEEIAKTPQFVQTPSVTPTVTDPIYQNGGSTYCRARSAKNPCCFSVFSTLFKSGLIKVYQSSRFKFIIHFASFQPMPLLGLDEL